MTAAQSMDLNLTEATSLAGDLFRARRYSEAENIFRALIEVGPGDFHAFHALAVCLIEQDRPAEAMPYLERAGLLIRNETLALSANRGKALGELGRTSEALKIFDQLILTSADTALFHYSRGLMRMQGGDYRGAIVDFDASIRLDPSDGKALFGRGFANLVLGNYADGFRDYEFRLKDVITDPGKPEWTGSENIADKTILVHGEQGHGDDIMFMRYLPMLVARGAQVIVVLHPGVAPLARGIHGVTVVSEDRATWPHFDLWVRAMSLAYCFRTIAETIPSPIMLNFYPYCLSQWQGRIAMRRKVKIGLCWSGSLRSKYDAHRSIPLEHLIPLFDLPGTAFYSLQLGLRDRDRAAFDILTARGLIDLAPHLSDFSETAHAMACLDAVITVDTSVAHLAGTVGLPTFVMLTAFRTYWPWIEKMQTSPWYPSIRVFRQRTDGDWSSLIAHMKGELQLWGRGEFGMRSMALATTAA